MTRSYVSATLPSYVSLRSAPRRWCPSRGLPKEHPGVLDELTDTSKEAAGRHAVRDAMIERQREMHGLAHLQLAVFYHRPLRDRANAQNPAHRRNEDGREGLHAVDTEVTDPERATGPVIEGQRVAAGALHHRHEILTHLLKRLPVDVEEHRRHQAIL